jgi:hypothetical protein
VQEVVLRIGKQIVLAKGTQRRGSTSVENGLSTTHSSIEGNTLLHMAFSVASENVAISALVFFIRHGIQLQPANAQNLSNYRPMDILRSTCVH